MENKQIVINTRSVIAGFLIVIGLIFSIGLLWLIKDIVVYLFIGLILALVLEPFVEWLVKKKIPRSISVLVVMASFITILVFLGSLAIVPLTYQIQALVANFPAYVNYFLQITGIKDATQVTNALMSQFSQSSVSIINATLGLFSGVLTMFVVLLFTLYIMFDLHNLRVRFIEVFPMSLQQEIRLIILTVEKKLGGWLRGQITLMFIIGLTTYIGLEIIGMPYALALAVIAGLLEIVPVIGPIIGSVPAIVIAFSINPIMGFGVLFLYLVVQQLENNLIVPKVMQKAVGFDPLVTIIALMIGSNLYGVMGALISIPVTIILFEVYKTSLRLSQNNRKK